MGSPFKVEEGLYPRRKRDSIQGGRESLSKAEEGLYPRWKRVSIQSGRGTGENEYTKV
jgi:hypothetical protein